MEEIPKEMKAVLLEVVLMPNGHIMSLGKVIGFFDKCKHFLREMPNDKE